MERFIKVVRENELQALAYLVSFVIALISFIIWIAVWQNTVNIKVSADDTAIQGIQVQLSTIQTELNGLNAKAQVTVQQAQDLQSTVNLILQKVQ